MTHCYNCHHNTSFWWLNGAVVNTVGPQVDQRHLSMWSLHALPMPAWVSFHSPKIGGLGQLTVINCP